MDWKVRDHLDKYKTFKLKTILVDQRFSFFWLNYRFFSNFEFTRWGSMAYFSIILYTTEGSSALVSSVVIWVVKSELTKDYIFCFFYTSFSVCFPYLFRFDPLIQIEFFFLRPWDNIKRWIVLILSRTFNDTYLHQIIYHGSKQLFILAIELK